MMEPMICETFLQFRYLSDLGLSPDGRYTAYIRQQANLASNGYDARLWVYDHSTGAVSYTHLTLPTNSLV